MLHAVCWISRSGLRSVQSQPVVPTNRQKHIVNQHQFAVPAFFSSAHVLHHLWLFVFGSVYPLWQAFSALPGAVDIYATLNCSKNCLVVAVIIIITIITTTTTDDDNCDNLYRSLSTDNKHNDNKHNYDQNCSFNILP